MRIRVLGECTIEVGAKRITPDASYLFALLLRLAADPRRQFQRQELVDLLYPDSRARDALHSIRQLTYQARRFGAGVETMGRAMRLVHPLPVFDLDDSLESYANATPFPSEHFTVLPGFHPAISTPFTHWLGAFRDRGEARIRAVLLDTMDVARARADWPRVELLARACLSSDPENEMAILGLADALARGGSTNRAVATLEARKAAQQVREEAAARPAVVWRTPRTRAAELRAVCPACGGRVVRNAGDAKESDAQAGSSASFPLDVEAFVGRLASIAAMQGDAATVAILVDSMPAIAFSRSRTVSGREHHHFTLRLSMPPALYVRLRDEPERMTKRLRVLAKKASAAHDACFVVNSVLLTLSVDSPEPWRGKARAWLRGAGWLRSSEQGG